MGHKAHGPNLADCLLFFCMTHKLRIVFTIIKFFLKEEDFIIHENYEIQISVFIN